MQAADHRDRQSTAAVQDLGDARAGSDDGLQILAGEALLLHPELDGLNRIGGVDRMVLILIRIDQGCQYVEPVSFQGT
jgi:hypothetical protein